MKTCRLTSSVITGAPDPSPCSESICDHIEKQGTNPEAVVVRLRGVDLGEEEAGLAATVIAVDVARHGESRLEYLREKWYFSTHSIL